LQTSVKGTVIKENEMPATVQAVISALIPDFTDLAVKYPRHVGMAQGTMNPVWLLAARPETFLIARALATLGFPPVTAIADDVERLHRAGGITAQWDLTKQFSGVAIAVLMEGNGFVNTGRKRGVPHDAWNVGTCFSLPPATPGAQLTPDAPEEPATA
jgi:hypothetical protein